MKKIRRQMTTTGRKNTYRDIFEDPKKLKTRIIAMMRADFKKSPMYEAAKKRAFIGDAMYQCEMCGQKYYTGSSKKNYDKLLELHKGLKKGAERNCLQMDHKTPVIPLDSNTEEEDLMDIAKRVYANENDMQYICKSPCHKEKTKKETELRKKFRNK